MICDEQNLVQSISCQTIFLQQNYKTLNENLKKVTLEVGTLLLFKNKIPNLMSLSVLMLLQKKKKTTNYSTHETSLICVVNI